MLDSVRWHLAHQKPFPLLALGIAGWMRYVGGIDEQGNRIDVSDPLLSVITQSVSGSKDGEDRVNALLAINAIFGDDLPLNAHFVQAVQEAYQRLLAQGAKAAVAYSVRHAE